MPPGLALSVLLRGPYRDPVDVNVGVKMPRGTGLSRPPAVHPVLTLDPRRTSLDLNPTGWAGRVSVGLGHLLEAAHRGHVRGWWRRGTPPALAFLSRSATCFRSGLSPRTGRATCACWRLRAWSGTWTAAHTRKCSRCARPLLHPQGGDGTWRYLHIDAFGSDGAQVQSQLSDTCTARPRVSPASTSCARFS